MSDVLRCHPRKAFGDRPDLRGIDTAALDASVAPRTRSRAEIEVRPQARRKPAALPLHRRPYSLPRKDDSSSPLATPAAAAQRRRLEQLAGKGALGSDDADPIAVPHRPRLRIIDPMASPPDSPTLDLARRFAARFRSRGSLAPLVSPYSHIKAC